MKTIGLLGGMSWESTVTYYRMINEGVKARLGGLHSAKVVLYSVDFAPLERLLAAGDWDGIFDTLCHASISIQTGGADFMLICTNTMHVIANRLEPVLAMPLLHIADATANALVADGVKKVGLLGTAATMEQDFYKGRLKDRFGLDVVIPSADDRKIVNEVIFKELCLGKALPESKAEYLRIIMGMADQGVGAVILGCTEIGMLVSQDDTNVPLYDTTAIHAKAAVDYALE